MLPKRIAIPEIFIAIFNPIIFVGLSCVTLILIAFHPIALIPLIIGFCVVGLIPKVRNCLVQGILDQFILFYSIILCARKKKIVAWDN